MGACILPLVQARQVPPPPHTPTHPPTTTTTHAPPPPRVPPCAEAYRHAVDVNPRDYRAWYGLGQTYELVNMPYYALYYFRRYGDAVWG